MADAENVSPQEKKIIRQVEYYFGDFNFPRDKFLTEEAKVDEGWVTMETMMKFKRLADLSKDKAEIVAAIKKSKAGLMAVSEDDSKIRRDPAIPLPENTEESRKLLEARTVYAKGFDKENTTLDELLDHFNETNPNVVSIQMRNWSDKKGKEKTWHFKGSVFITFKTGEAATEFVESKDFKYKDNPLVIKFQKDYFEEKSKENEARKRGKSFKGKDSVKTEAVKEEKVEPKDDITLPKGATLKLTGLGGEITREDIKEVLQEKFDVNIDKDKGDIAFVTYEKGESEAKIRFRVENFAKPVAEKWLGLDEKVEIKGAAIVASLLEGEEEEKFLADSVQDLRNRRNKNRGHKRRGGGHHGHGGKRGRR